MRARLPEALSPLVTLATQPAVVVGPARHAISSAGSTPTSGRRHGDDPVAVLAAVRPRAAARAHRRSRLHAVPVRDRGRAHALPHERPLVPGSRGRRRCGSVAYFSPEFGITEALPQYSGGLGVLAGDHLKAVERPRRAARRRRPVLPPGLLPPEPRRRRLAAGALSRPRPVRDGADAVRRACASPSTSPATPLHAQVWRADVGRMPLYLLDADIDEQRRPTCASVTDRLYGGDVEHRLARRSCSASAACGRSRPSALDAAGLPHQRGPRRLPRPRAHPPADRDGGPLVRRGARGGAGRRRSSPRTPRCRPASTASRGS